MREGRVGVWVERKGPGWSREDKIAAIGVRLRKWVSFHGIAFNVEPDLEHFSGITPCGISGPQFGVTSLVDLGLPVTMSDADAALRASFEDVFGAVHDAPFPEFAQQLEARVMSDVLVQAKSATASAQTPSNWKGWAFIAAYIRAAGLGDDDASPPAPRRAALLLTPVRSPPSASRSRLHWSSVYVSWRKTEGGWRWRWGDDDERR